MFEERYKHLMDGVRPKETLLNATLRAARKRRVNWRWAAASACAILCVAVAVFWINLPPRDRLAANGEISQINGEFLPIEVRYPCCDVRNMELQILSGSIRQGILFVEFELAGQGIHQDMVITVRMQDDAGGQEAFHLLWDEEAYAKHGEGRITHLVSYKLDEDAIPQEGRRLTLAVNNYDCGLDHDRYPHWTEDEAWDVVRPDCNTVDFTITNEGWILLPNE